MIDTSRLPSSGVRRKRIVTQGAVRVAKCDKSRHTLKRDRKDEMGFAEGGVNMKRAHQNQLQHTIN